MPRGDGTGPAGLGPMTGRGLGYCAGYPYPGYMNPIGRWIGRGRGVGWGGRGWRHWYRATGLPGWWRAWLGYPAWGSGGYYPYSWVKPTPQEEKEMIKEEKEIIKEEIDLLKEQMKALEDRLEELKKKK